MANLLRCWGPEGGRQHAKGFVLGAFTKSVVSREITHSRLLADHPLQMAIHSDYGPRVALSFRADKRAAIGLIKTSRTICSLSDIYRATVVIRANGEPVHTSNQEPEVTTGQSHSRAAAEQSEIQTDPMVSDPP